MYNDFIEIKNFLNVKTSKNIIEEIKNFRKFDDLVMGGRKRINKGTKNFKVFLSKSPYSNTLFKKMNNKKFFKKIAYRFFENKKKNWNINLTNTKYLKKVSGVQKGNGITREKTDLKKNILYLDMDFSVSEKGYQRGPHRDRDSRIVNFLIYLNTLSKFDGGTLCFYQIKKINNFKFPRFPKFSELKSGKKFKANRGVCIFFLSSPDSYHSVSKFLGKNNKKRYFIYGSYSLNKPVNWKKLF